MEAMKAEDGDLDQKLQKFLLKYMSTSHTITGQSPAEEFFQRKIGINLAFLQPRTELHESNSQEISVPPFRDGERIWYRDYLSSDKWHEGVILRRIGMVMYEILVGKQRLRTHISQIRRNYMIDKRERSFPNIEQHPGLDRSVVAGRKTSGRISNKPLRFVDQFPY